MKLVKWVCALAAAGGCGWLGGQALLDAAQLAQLHRCLISFHAHACMASGSLHDQEGTHSAWPTRLPLPLPCRQQEGGAPLEEIAASFARFFGSIDLEKLDVVVGFVLVEVLQESRRAVHEGSVGR